MFIPDPNFSIPDPGTRGKKVTESRIRFRHTGGKKNIHIISIADPDPLDPHVFGPPGSGSISQMYGSGSESFYRHVKITRKTLVPTIL
jgi:hypothetical protein